jgi:hypothetical protein
MKKNIILIVVVMLMAAPAYAHLYDNDFEAHTVGASVTAETHESWTWYTPGASAVFANDGGNTVIDLNGPGQTHLNIGGYNSPIDEVLELHLNYEFDIKISNFDRWDIYFSDNATSDVIAPSFNKTTSSSGSVSYKVDGVQTDVAVPGFVVGEWAHASIQLNQLAETWSMNLAGTQIVTDGLLANTTGNGGNWAVSTERLIFEVPGSILIDNIVITEIPEPATMCLLGFGGLLLRRKRK